MKQSRLFATAVAFVALGTATVNAQGRSGNAGNPHASSAQGSKSNGSPSGTTTTTTTGGSTAPHGSGVNNGNGHKPEPPTTTTASGGTTTTTGGTTTGSGDTSASGGTQGTTTTTTPIAPNAIAAKIARNPDQLVRISAMLPQGMTLDQASSGFRNQGQFIAALNASKRTSVPFADLKDAMTVKGMSLGQAVKQLQAVPPAPTTTTTTTTTTGTGTTGTGTSTTGGTGTTTSGTGTTGGSTTTTSSTGTSAQPKS